MEVYLVEGRVVRIVIGPARPAGQERAAAETLARFDEVGSRGHVARADGVTHGDRLLVVLPEPDQRQVAARELLRAVGDPPQHRLDVEGDGERTGDVGQDLRLPAAPLAVLEQARVLERERRLGGERLQELDLSLGERPDVVPIRDERAEHAISDEQRRG